MSRARRLGLIVAAAALAAAASVPLSLVTRHLAVPGLAANEATGSLWSGELRAARLGGRLLGDTSVALRPLPLLLGERRLDVSGESWSARLVQGRRNGVLASHGMLPPPVLPPLDGATMDVSLRQARLLFEGGSCVDAGGNVVAVLRWQDAELPELQLEGPVECAGGVGRITLTDAGRGPFPVQLLATVSGDGSYSLQATAQPADPRARIALLMGGFRETPSGLGRTSEGSLFR